MAYKCKKYPLKSFEWKEVCPPQYKKLRWLAVHKKKITPEQAFDTPPYFDIKGKNETKKFFYNARSDVHVYYLDMKREIEVRFEIED